MPFGILDNNGSTSFVSEAERRRLRLRDRRDERDPEIVERERQAKLQAEAAADHRGAVDRDRARVNPFNFDRQYDMYSSFNQEDAKRGLRQDNFRDRQDWLLQQLKADAAGNGPGQALARMQAQNMADRGAQQQMAMAAAGRPGNSASAGTRAAFNGANIQSAVGGQAAEAGLKARLGALGQMGQAAESARRGDIAQMGLNDQRQLEALRQRLQLTGMRQQGEQWWQGNQFQRSMQPSNAERLMGMAGQGAQTYAAIQTGGASNAATGGGGSNQGSPYGQSSYGNGVSQPEWY